MNSSIRTLLLALLALAAGPAIARAQAVPDSVLAVTRAGTSILRANVDGKVGIGTSTPDRKLTVNGTIGATDTIATGVGIRFPDGSVQTTAAVAAGPNSGTSANTPNTLVARDGTGSFAAGKVTLDSLSVAGRAQLGRATLDSLTAGKARLDSLTVAGRTSLAGVAADSLHVTGNGIRFPDGSLQASAATTATGTSANTPGALVQRDAGGDFSAGEVTLDSLTAGKARLDSLAVTGSGIRFADGSVQSTAATSATGTSANTPGTLVQRDANGGFAAGKVTADSLSVAGHAALGRATLDSLTVAGRSTMVGVTLDSLKVAGNGIRFADGTLQSTAATTATGTSTNTPSTLVARDASGNFAAGTATLRALTISDNEANSGASVRLQIRSGSNLGERFVVDSAGGVLAAGSLGIGIILKEGSGERMIWHPYRAAFRAGGVSGDQWNDPNMGFYSAAFGQNTQAEGNWSIAAGHSSFTDQPYSVAMGFKAHADGIAAVAMGYQATANAQYSIALGRSVTTMGYSGAIVIGDGSLVGSDSLQATADNQFSLRAAGGIRMYTNTAKTAGVLMQGWAPSATPTASTPWSGCSNVIWMIAASNCAYLSNAGAWTNVSDRNRKHGFAAVAGEDVLARLRGMPVTTWTYNADGDEVRHLGPTAQDFHAAFGLNGADETHIATIDADGVALAGVKALDARTTLQEARVQAVERDNAALRAENAELRARLDAIERMLRAQAPAAPERQR